MNHTLRHRLTCAALIVSLGACSAPDDQPNPDPDVGAQDDASSTLDTGTGTPDTGDDVGGADVGGADAGDDAGADARDDASAPASLSRTVAEPMGENCPGGGMRTEVGLDTNRNEQLDDDEVDPTQTTYACEPFDEPLAFTQISAGSQHTCGVTTRGGAKCWGHNASGQLGDGTLVDQNEPTDVIGLTSGVVRIAAGDVHTCAIMNSGDVKCWGGNASGQLGDGSQTQRLEPVVSLALAVGTADVSVGADHTCAVSTGGSVFCWGDNTEGQLGNGTRVSSNTPVDVSGLGSAVAIAAGAHHTCAISTTGGVTCWGDNDSGQLGDDSNDDRTAPVGVAGLSADAASISAGRTHTCSVSTAGAATCWGNNFFGALGEGTTRQRTTPQGVSGLSSSAATISAGDAFTCAVTTAGAAKCWGANGASQLGNGATDNETFPDDVSDSASEIASISAGADHACALSTTGKARCWGENSSGQLGLGYTDGVTTTPQDVLDD